jgi:hypothetical protein
MSPTCFAKYVPTEDDIKRECERIKAGWSVQDYESRDMYDRPAHYELPFVSARFDVEVA